MKKVINSLFLVMVGLLMISSASAQAKEIPVRVVNSDAFSVKSADLLDNNGVLQLHFSIFNKSKEAYPGLEVVLTTYNKRGGLKGRHIWKTQEAMSPDSLLTSVIGIGAGLKGGFRYNVEFLVPAQSAIADSCTTCTENAIAACGAGKVKEVSCQLGENNTYSCTYSCKGELGGEEGGS